MKAIIAIAIILIVSIICLIFWHIKIDSETTWIYGIYLVFVNIIFSLFALINFL